MRRGRHQGVSTMVGMAIVVAIFFTTLVPLYLYMSNLYNLFSNELNSRRIRDIDRATEELKLLVEGRTEINPAGPSISLTLKNTSPLMIRVERIWAMDVNLGTPVNDTPCIDSPIDIPAGMNITVQVSSCLEGFTGKVQFIAVTERGRLFGSAPVDIIRGRLVAGLYPYTLTVSVVNMERGKEYTIDILPLGDADTQPRSIKYKATASNENISLSFGATAGTFLVYLAENGILVSSTRLLAPARNPMSVTLPDYWNVVFILNRDGISSVVTIDLEIVAPSSVLEGQAFAFDILLTLPDQAEENVQADAIAIMNALKLQGDYDRQSLSCTPFSSILSAGSTITVLSCFARASELQGNRNYGSITITVDPVTAAGIGVDSGQQYPSDGDSVTIQVVRQRGGR
ncbi:MAG: hypothetical protein QXK61_00635 [Nitrososphaerota archaeon]